MDNRMPSNGVDYVPVCSIITVARKQSALNTLIELQSNRYFFFVIIDNDF